MTLRTLILGLSVLLQGCSGGRGGAPPQNPTHGPPPSRPNYSELDAEEQCLAAEEFEDPDPPQQCRWGLKGGGASWCPPGVKCNRLGALQIVANTITPGEHPDGFAGYFYVLFGEKPAPTNSAHRFVCESFFRKVPDSSEAAMKQRVVTLWPAFHPIPPNNGISSQCEVLLSAYHYVRARGIVDRLKPCMRPSGRNEVVIVGLESGGPIPDDASKLGSVWGIKLKGDDPRQVEAALTYWFNEVQDAREPGWFESFKARVGDGLEAIVAVVRGSECV